MKRIKITADYDFVIVVLLGDEDDVVDQEIVLTYDNVECNLVEVAAAISRLVGDNNVRVAWSNINNTSCCRKPGVLGRGLKKELGSLLVYFDYVPYVFEHPVVLAAFVEDGMLVTEGSKGLVVSSLSFRSSWDTSKNPFRAAVHEAQKLNPEADCFLVPPALLDHFNEIAVGQVDFSIRQNNSAICDSTDRLKVKYNDFRLRGLTSELSKG